MITVPMSNSPKQLMSLIFGSLVMCLLLGLPTTALAQDKKLKKIRKLEKKITKLLKKREYMDAAMYSEEVKDLTVAVYGPVHRETASSYVRLSEIRKDQGDVFNAEKDLRSALNSLNGIIAVNKELGFDIYKKLILAQIYKRELSAADQYIEASRQFATKYFGEDSEQNWS